MSWLQSNKFKSKQPAISNNLTNKKNYLIISHSLDLMLPGISGEEVLWEIMEIENNLAVTE